MGMIFLKILSGFTLLNLTRESIHLTSSSSPLLIDFISFSHPTSFMILSVHQSTNNLLYVYYIPKALSTAALKILLL